MYKLTVITPVFNSIQFIELCLLNVIQQKCKSVEHIIMDAGSTDSTLEVIQKYAKEYPHIKWISEKDKGQSDAMNKGIKMASAEVISFLNVDDGYNPFTLNRIVDIFEANPSLEFITGNCKLFDLEGKLIYINRPQRVKHYHLFSYLEPFPINPAAYFYKKSVHEKTGLYTVENHSTMDYEFILKACTKTNIIYFNEDWGYAIYHENSKTLQDIEQNQMFVKKLETFKREYALVSFKVKLMSKLYTVIKKIKKAING